MTRVASRKEKEREEKSLVLSQNVIFGDHWRHKVQTLIFDAIFRHDLERTLAYPHAQVEYTHSVGSVARAEFASTFSRLAEKKQFRIACPAFSRCLEIGKKLSHYIGNSTSRVGSKAIKLPGMAYGAARKTSRWQSQFQRRKRKYKVTPEKRRRVGRRHNVQAGLFLPLLPSHAITCSISGFPDKFRFSEGVASGTSCSTPTTNSEPVSSKGLATIQVL